MPVDTRDDSLEISWGAEAYLGQDRRIGGKKKKAKKIDKVESFEETDPRLPVEMELHLGMRKLYPLVPAQYSGVKMIDEVDRELSFCQRPVFYSLPIGDKELYLEVLDDRLRAYEACVNRGGTMVDKDFATWQWVPNLGDWKWKAEEKYNKVGCKVHCILNNYGHIRCTKQLVS